MNNLSLSTVKGYSQTKHATPTNAEPSAIPSFDTLPDSALIRQSQLVQDSKRPGVPAPLPFSPSTLWRLTRAGKFPQPVRLTRGMTCWRVGDVRAWMAQAQAKGGSHE